MPPVWQSPGTWSAALQARQAITSNDLPGNLWFRMTAPDGTQRRIHSGLAARKLAKGWFLAGEFVQQDDGEFPPT